MTSKSYPPSFIEYGEDLKEKQNTLLPDDNTYKKVREYARFIKSNVEKGNTLEFKKTLTLREFFHLFQSCLVD